MYYQSHVLEIIQVKMHEICKECFFTLSYLYMIEKRLIFGQIFEMGILMELHILRTPQSERHIFRGWYISLSLCACLL